MATRPAFADLRTAKPAPEPEVAVAEEKQSSAPKPARKHIQTSVRLTHKEWTALNSLAASKRDSPDAPRVSIHDLVKAGIHHILAVNGIELRE
jgi:hypothetical protein